MKYNFAVRSKIEYQVKSALKRSIADIDNVKGNIELILSQLTDKKPERFLLVNGVINVSSIAENFLFDVSEIVLKSFPAKITSKKWDVSDFEFTQLSSGIFRQAIERELNGIKYKKFKEIMPILQKISDLDGFDDELIDNFAEIKATRDILLHADGKCNWIYREKAGGKARAESGAMLPIDKPYFDHVHSTGLALCQKFGSQVANKFGHYNKAKCFKDMWEASQLNQRVEFARAWEYKPDMGMVVPKDFTWAWSHGEKMLFDFFSNIYYGPTKNPLNIAELIDRWNSESVEGQIVLSWVENPFYF